MTFNIIQRGNVCPNFIAILALQLFTFYDENEDSPGEARVGSCIALLVCWVLISLSLVTGHVFARVMGAQWAEWSCPALAPTVYFPQLMVQQTPGPQFVSCCNVANMGGLKILWFFRFGFLPIFLHFAYLFSSIFIDTFVFSTCLKDINEAICCLTCLPRRWRPWLPHSARLVMVMMEHKLESSWREHKHAAGLI